MKKPTRQDISNEFDKWVDKNDVDDLQSIFEAGIEYALEYQKPSNIMKIFTELGFPVDVKLIYDIMIGEVEHKLYDELYNMDNIEITKVDISRTKSNWSDQWIVIYFSAFWDNGKYDDNTIKIDNLGRVTVDVNDTPWESGGLSRELEEIVMGLVTRAKYALND
jgi:hypothetical protein